MSTSANLNSSSYSLRPNSRRSSALAARAEPAEVETVLDSEGDGSFAARTSSSVSVSAHLARPARSASSGSGTSAAPPTNASISNTSKVAAKRKFNSLPNDVASAANNDENPIMFTKKICRDTADIVDFLGEKYSVEQTKTATAVARLERCCADAQLECLKILKELNEAKRAKARADLNRNEELIAEYTENLKDAQRNVDKLREDFGKNATSYDLASDVDDWDEEIEASSVADAVLPSSETDIPSSDL